MMPLLRDEGRDQRLDAGRFPPVAICGGTAALWLRQMDASVAAASGLKDLRCV